MSSNDSNREVTQEEVVAGLEALVELAKTGDLQGIVVGYVTNDLNGSLAVGTFSGVCAAQKICNMEADEVIREMMGEAEQDVTRLDS